MSSKINKSLLAHRSLGVGGYALYGLTEEEVAIVEESTQ